MGDPPALAGNSQFARRMQAARTTDDWEKVHASGPATLRSVLEHNIGEQRTAIRRVFRSFVSNIMDCQNKVRRFSGVTGP